jgi:hypothetical protein
LRNARRGMAPCVYASYKRMIFRSIWGIPPSRRPVSSRYNRRSREEMHAFLRISLR